MKDFSSGRLRQCFLFLLACLLLVLASVKTVVARERSEETCASGSAEGEFYGTYCGIYCIYATIRMSGQEVDFRGLVRPEYLGSRKGSSLAELKKAAEDNRLHAAPLANLTSKILRNCPHAVILHVKSDITSREYNHYELLLGTESGKARVLNPPGPVRLVSFQELAPRWDGNGLIVSAQPIDLGSIFAPSRKRLATYAAIVVAIILSVRWARQWLPETMLNCRRRRLLGLSAAQGAVVGIAALLCGMIYHFASDEGLLANANATASIQHAHSDNFIPKVSTKKVQNLLDGGAVFVDARFASDFQTGHLKGAINIPVDANDVTHSEATAGIGKDAQIVVYCQSAGCRFAQKVAARLIGDGFSDVSVFKGGWNEWRAKKED